MMAVAENVLETELDLFRVRLVDIDNMMEIHCLLIYINMQ